MEQPEMIDETDGPVGPAAACAPRPAPPGAWWRPLTLALLSATLAAAPPCTARARAGTPTSPSTATAVTTSSTTGSRTTTDRVRTASWHRRSSARPPRRTQPVPPRPAPCTSTGRGQRRAGGVREAERPRAADHPRRSRREGKAFQVVVRYHGAPLQHPAVGLVPLLQPDGEGLAIGEPQIGPWWFAANEPPRGQGDLRHPDPGPERQAGDQQRSARRASRDEGSGRAWRWGMTEPMVTYLAFFAAGDYAIEEGAPTAGHPSSYAVFRAARRDGRQHAFALLHRTPTWSPG